MIGIFDSGLGGLTVLKEIRKLLPKDDVIYLGDTARLPYGTKSKETITRYSIENADFLMHRGASIIIIACNTASSLAGNTLKKYNTSVPVFEVITPAIKRAQRVTKNGRVGVIGTPATINSGVYEKNMRGYRVIGQSCPLLVPLIEEGWLKRNITKKVLANYLAPLKRSRIDTLILACTHYPLLTPLIRDIMGGEITIVNPAEELAQELVQFKNRYPNRFTEKNGNIRFFVTDAPYQFETFSKTILGEKINAKRITLGD